MSTERSTIEGTTAGGSDAGGRRWRRARAADAHGDRQPHRAAATSCRSQDGTVRAMDLRQIKTDEDDFGLMAYDPPT